MLFWVVVISIFWIQPEHLVKRVRAVSRRISQYQSLQPPNLSRLFIAVSSLFKEDFKIAICTNCFKMCRIVSRCVKWIYSTISLLNISQMEYMKVVCSIDNVVTSVSVSLLRDRREFDPQCCCLCLLRGRTEYMNCLFHPCYFVSLFAEG